MNITSLPSSQTTKRKKDNIVLKYKTSRQVNEFAGKCQNPKAITSLKKSGAKSAIVHI